MSLTTATLHPLTRRALSAARHWLPTTRVEDRLRIAGWCELSDAECEALDQLRANLRAAAPEARWFDESKERLRSQVAQVLTDGLLVDQRDVTEFLRLLRYPDRTLVYTIAYDQWLRKGIEPLLKPRWESRKAAQALEDGIRTEQRAARERAQAEAQAAAALARQQQAVAEWEQRRKEPAAKAQEKPMDATLNGNGKHALAMPEGLTDLQRDVWDEMIARGLNPLLDVGFVIKQSIATKRNSTAGSVGAAMSTIRKKLREAGSPLPLSPVEARVLETVAPEPVVAAVAPQDLATGHAREQADDEEACIDPMRDEEIGRLEDALAAWKGAAEQANEELAQTTALAARLETQLEVAITERAVAWKQLHELKSAAPATEPQPTTLTDGERRLALDLAAGCDVAVHLAERTLAVRAEILRLAHAAVLAVVA